MHIYYDTPMSIVANPRGRVNAAFKRFKRGEDSTYQFRNKNWDGSLCCQYVKDGRRTQAYYTFETDEVAPSILVGKSLEDYL